MTTSPPTHGAMAIITNRAGRYLMHLRDDIPGIAWPGHWSTIGGGREAGETSREAIVRELREEAGLTVEGLTEFCQAPDVNGSGQHLTFFSATWEGDPRSLPLTEGRELDWVAPEQWDTLLIPGFVLEILQRHRAVSS